MLGTGDRDEPIRLLHFSDIHVQAPLSAMRKRELFSKRAIGLGNLWLRRARRFTHFRERMQRMVHFFEEQKPDAVICTGDVTTVGTQAELEVAAALLQPFTTARYGLHLVAGNHDIYLRDVLADKRFETTLANRGNTGALDESLRIIPLLSARPNPQPWRSSGHINRDALQQLSQVLEQTPPVGWNVVMTHYAPRLASGLPDSYRHGLTNYEALESVLRGRPQTILLHGHIHERFHLTAAQASVPTFCAGSCTDAKYGGFWMYEVEPTRFRAFAGEWNGNGYALLEQPPIEL